MRINTKGLVISEQTVSESDKLITIITQNIGIIRAFVKSARNIKNKNSIATQLLSYSDFSIYKGKDKYIVNEAEVIELFFELRSDIEKLTLAQYFCEVAITVGSREEKCSELLRLILNSLYYLVKEAIPKQRLKSIVEMRAISISGFMPNLVCCNECGCYQADVMYLSLNEGKIICKECFASNNKDSVALDKGTTAALRHIIYSKFENIFSFVLDEKSQENLSVATEKYFLAHTDRFFKTLEFYLSLQSE